MQQNKLTADEISFSEKIQRKLRAEETEDVAGKKKAKYKSKLKVAKGSPK